MDDLERTARLVGERVRVPERGGDLVDHVAGERRRQPRPAAHELVEQRRQVAPGDVLHRQVVLAVGDAELEHLHDAAMVQERAEPRLVGEQAHEVGIVRQLGQDALDHQLAREPFGALADGAEDLRHAAGAEALDEPVGSECDGGHRMTSVLLRRRARSTLATDRLGVERELVDPEA